MEKLGKNQIAHTSTERYHTQKATSTNKITEILYNKRHEVCRCIPAKEVVRNYNPKPLIRLHTFCHRRVQLTSNIQTWHSPCYRLSKIFTNIKHQQHFTTKYQCTSHAQLSSRITTDNLRHLSSHHSLTLKQIWEACTLEQCQFPVYIYNL